MPNDFEIYHDLGCPFTVVAAVSAAECGPTQATRLPLQVTGDYLPKAFALDDPASDAFKFRDLVVAEDPAIRVTPSRENGSENDAD